jgi:fatty-acyl-CoA synthase
MTYNFDLGIEHTQKFVQRTSRFTIGDQLRKTARMAPDRVAIAAADTELTYGELDRRTNRLANGLLDAGYEPNESTIAILSENRAETLELLFACAKVGVLAATLNWRLEREELVHCVDLAEPDALVVSERFTDRLDWVEADAETDPDVVGYDGNLDPSLDDIRAQGAAERPIPDTHVDPEQGFVVINTSGTTGLPKGVVISHRAEFARATQVIIDFGLERGDSFPGWAPMFHMGGIGFILVTLVLGGTFYPIDGFDPERVTEVLLESPDPISWLFLVPGTIEPLVDHVQERGLDASDFPPIRTMGALADLVDPDLIAEATETFDTPYQNTYGASESGHVASGNKLPIGERPPDTDLPKTESPFVDVKLIDEDWNEVESRGELAVRGPGVCSGYIDAPETNETEFRDGWFRTGDIFTRNADGTYTFVNRRKYLIKSGGENIYPKELEAPIADLDRVTEVVVVRAEDDEWGEVPRAVVATTDLDDTDGLREEIIATLDSELARYKLPHYIEFCDPDALPRSTSGKVVRPDVEAWDLESATRVRNP